MKSIKIREITDYLESIAPLSYQESYDNCGLIVGSHEQQVSKVLITLDCTEAVIDEAIKMKCGLVVAHHPIVFAGLKKLNGKTYVERVVMKAIKYDIAIYAIHTNYDNVKQGVNAMICARLGLTDTGVLVPKKQLLRKLYTFVPVYAQEVVSQALFSAGAGHIGEYSETSFSGAGIGSFKGGADTHPSIGKPGEKELVEELKIEVVYPAHIEDRVVAALLAAHPYEEVAYDLISLENKLPTVGAGMIGHLPRAMSELNLLKMVKKSMGAGVLRHTALLGRAARTIAVCGGAGSSLLRDAIGARADVYITADFKYHEFFDAEGKIVIADIGHYESEQYTKELLFGHLSEKFPTFAFLLSKVNTNPVKYIS